MIPAARIAALIELAELVEESIEEGGLPADVIIGQYFRARRYAGSKDRRAISGHMYAYLRSREWLLWAIAEVDANLGARLLVLLYLAHFHKKELIHLAEESKFSADAITDEEQTYIEKAQVLSWGNVPESIQANIPAWALPGLKERFKDETAVELEAANKQANLNIRINSLKAKPETINDIKKSIEDIEKNKFSKDGYSILSSINLGGMPAYNSGLIEVQDEAAQVASELVAVEPAMQVMDLCAGAGGKSLHVSALMQNKGQIYALDTSAKRLSECQKRLQRGGHRNVQVIKLASEGKSRPAELSKYNGSCDRVFIDAPCTGTGTWRRSPDQRWRFDDEKLKELTDLQSSLLDEGAKAVKPGGRLIYMTCSMLPQENEGVTKKFLQNQNDNGWALLSYKDVWAEKCSPNMPQTAALIPEALQLTPYQHGTDGFYVAIFELTNS